MALQIARRARFAISIQVTRGGAEQPPIGRDLACGQAGVGQVAETYRHVEAFFDQVQRPVRQPHQHLHVRILAGEVRHGRHDVGAPETECGVQPQEALGLGAGA
ncbi:hypothetical protein G6F66_015400 [Rhizopus arrhizus]|nr:hypothetical protein G6F66_015400 [Rhizopus arrhizus]